MNPYLMQALNFGQGIMKTPAAQNITRATMGIPLVNELSTFMDDDILSTNQKMQADQFGVGDINFSDTESYIGPEMIPGNQPMGFVDGGRNFSQFNQARMGNINPVKSNAPLTSADYERMDPSLLEEDQIGMTVEDLKNRPSFFGNIQNKIGSGLGSLKDFAIDKGKMGRNLLGSAGAMAMGLPGIVGSAAMSLLGGLKESPEQAAMMDLYNSKDYQNVLNQIPGMSNYNPVYGMGAGYGLDRAIGKRLSTLSKTRKRQGDKFSDTLRKREEALKNLLAQEKAIDFGRIGASGRRPGTTGGAYSGESRDSQSRGQASAGNTGGYSYDRGGRQGFGYGLKDGGLASMFTRRR